MYYLNLESRDALNLLGDIYYKIILVDLNMDKYLPIKIISPYWEKAKNKTFKFTDFLQNFIDEDLIYPKDLEAFKEFTNLDNLRRLMRGDNKCAYFSYYRKIVGKDYERVLMKVCTTYDNTKVIVSICSAENMVSLPIMNEPYDSISGCPTRIIYPDFFKENNNIGVAYIKLTDIDNKVEKLGASATNDLISEKASILKKVFIPRYCYRVGFNEFVAIIPHLYKDEFMSIAEEFVQVCDTVNVKDYIISMVHSSEFNTNDVGTLVQYAKGKVNVY